VSSPDSTCQVQGCQSVVYARGWCTMHYQRWRATGSPEKTKARPRSFCSVAGCERPAKGHGWCALHYRRWRDHGDPLYQPPSYPDVCLVDGCERKRGSKKGWCTMHYQRWVRHGDAAYERVPKACSVDGCDRDAKGYGWCTRHLDRWRRHGDPTKLILELGGPEAKFWANVTKLSDNECWPWTGNTQPSGHGCFRIGGINRRSHRFAYELLTGPIPPGFEIDHICHDPEACDGGDECPHRRCCNPAHLKAVPVGENGRRHRAVSWNGRKTHCKRGHGFTLDNTIITSKGSRQCRRCVAIRRQERAANRRKASE
jgi:hypothetical protein